MRTPSLAAAVLAVCSPLSAQFFTSVPSGYEFVEGSSDLRDVIGSMPMLRFQQVDSTNGPLFSVSRLGFRRDARLFTNAQFVGRTIDVELVFAESDVINLSTTFASNYIANNTVVMSRKQVALPDWTQIPAVQPAPVDAVMTLDAPYTYLGKQATGNDFLWEVKVWSTTAAGQDYPFDLAYVVPNAVFGANIPNRSGHLDLGRGCLVALGEAHLDADVFNYGTKFTFDAHLHTAPNSPVTLMMGVFDANLVLPTLCSKLHILGGVNLPVGVAGPTGDFDIDIDPIPYMSHWIGQELFFQTAAPDTSQFPKIPVALSSAAQLTVPGDPVPPAVGRVWAPNPNASVATIGPLSGGIIAHTSL